MRLYPKNAITLGELKRFLVIFYVVGTLGFWLPMAKGLFVYITPYALLLNTYLLAVYHTHYTKKAILAFSLVFLLGYLIEVVGVQTGLIFGGYMYGRGLGIKVFDTPLLIGVNWLFLIYASCSVVDRLRVAKWLRYIFPPVLMLCYDAVLEQVAPKMDMWSWQNGVIPVQNYVAWFVIALVFTSMLRLMQVDTKNPLSLILLSTQFVFLFMLMIIL